MPREEDQEIGHERSDWARKQRITAASLEREARQEEEAAMHHAREAQRLRRAAAQLRRNPAR